MDSRVVVVLFKAMFARVQAQPLSLEELLAKKKAEEEAEAKVSKSLHVLFFFLDPRLYIFLSLEL